MILTTFGTLYSMPTVITSQTLTPELWMDIVDRHKITVAYVNPRFCSTLQISEKLRKLDSIRILNVGGSVFTKKLIKDVAKNFPNWKVLTCYGTTEGDGIALACEFEDGLSLS